MQGNGTRENAPVQIMQSDPKTLKTQSLSNLICFCFMSTATLLIFDTVII